MLKPSYFRSEGQVILMGFGVVAYALYEAYINGNWHVFETCILPIWSMGLPLILVLMILNLVQRIWRWCWCSKR